MSTRQSTPALALLALGVVYGDIGTSPLYAVKETFNPEHGIPLTTANILGGLSAILVALFLIQKRGTAFVGMLFGPVCALWFVSLAAVGVWNIAKNPVILHALDPRHALHFVTGHGLSSFIVLGSVLLAITGAEAL